ASELSASREDVRQAAIFIQGLQPKPGSIYNTEMPQIARPDLTIEKAGDGFSVILHDDFLPTIRPSSQYQELAKGRDSEASKYVHDKYKQMMWLRKSIEQRQTTLIRVTQAL